MSWFEHDPSRSLLITDCYGPTFQNEGPSAGQLALIVRLSGCNLSCPSCDVPYTWDGTRFSLTEQSRRFSVDTLVECTTKTATRLMVITGGEPLMQQNGLVTLSSRMAELGWRVEIETNGTLVPSAELTAATHLFVVSPKLRGFAAITSPANRINDEALTAFVESGRAAFTFVAQTDDDIEEIIDLEQRFGLYPIWLQPEGTTSHRVLAGTRWLADRALVHRWNLSTRLHALLDTKDPDHTTPPGVSLLGHSAW